MSPPRRRRRRRGRGEQPEAPRSAPKVRPSPIVDERAGIQPRSRGRRRRPGHRQAQEWIPVPIRGPRRAAPKERPASLSGPPDGQTLEKLIGDLQSEWGVPQYPQEYRITIKVADERDVRSDRSSSPEPAAPSPQTGPAQPGPKRERAPAAPRVAGGGRRAGGSTETAAGAQAPATRERTRPAVRAAHVPRPEARVRKRRQRAPPASRPC